MFDHDRSDSATLIGIATIVATVFAMALADAVVKYASSDMTLWQIWVLRSLLVIPVLLWMAKGRLRTPAYRWVLLRSLALAMMYLGIYGALPRLDLSIVAATLYTGPLFIVLLSAVFLRDPIAPRHWIAIVVGFLGVIVIVRPGVTGFPPLALVPTGAALLYASAAVLTRAKCQQVSAPTLGLWLNLTLFTCGGVASLLVAYVRSGLKSDPFPASYPFLTGDWTWTMGRTGWIIGVLAVLMVGISIGLAKAYQAPRPHVIATFDYTFLVFAAFWGFVFFGEVPGGWTMTGIAMIVGAGLWVVKR